MEETHRVYGCVYIHVCLCISVFMCVCVCVCVCKYIYVCVCVNMCVYGSPAIILSVKSVSFSGTSTTTTTKIWDRSQHTHLKKLYTCYTNLCRAVFQREHLLCSQHVDVHFQEKKLNSCFPHSLATLLNCLSLSLP